jgi:NAD(P)-dependent dehydrogenase (short-subunit alcohol dehydrogenase family)
VADRIEPASLFDIRGRVALVTGASGAFGRMAARVLADAGAALVLAAGDRQRLNDAVPPGAGGNVITVNRRPKSVEDCAAMVDAAVAGFGALDILVVGSGVNDPAPIVEMSPERWDAVMEANVRASWLLCRAAGAKMIDQGRGGKVVLMSSTRGRLGHPAGYSAYCTSKAAVDGLTRALACEWGRHRINVNAIGPTVFRSDLTAWMFAEESRGRAAREGMLARIPLGRLGEPADLAGALLFLCSPASDFCTGQVIYVDGGYTAG